MVSPEWIGEIERSIEESEYHVNWQDATVLPDLEAAWHAANRAHDLRFYFTDQGLRVVDRTAEGGAELLGLAVVGIGREGALVAPSPTDVAFTTEAGRLVARRSGLTETFVNGTGGLRHRIEITGSPDGAGPLEIALRWSAAGIQLAETRAEFTTGTGRRLIYTLAAAVDATGAAIEAEFRVGDDSTLVLVVNDDDAVFPIVIENLLTATPNTVLEGNLSLLSFGWRVASARPQR